jgi:Lipid-droplet associated hydrolase
MSNILNVIAHFSSCLINDQHTLAASFISNLRYFIPPTFFKLLISYLTWQKESTVNVALLHVVENSLYMAGDEVENVCELDEELLYHEQELYHEHLDKFILYFSEFDKWAPLEHYKDHFLLVC